MVTIKTLKKNTLNIGAEYWVVCGSVGMVASILITSLVSLWETIPSQIGCHP
jgi:hypothetical protein